jgi:RNA polymerase sigma-70 factor (ECF subfamily)
MALNKDKRLQTGGLEFEGLVNRYYAALYQFGLGLSHSEAEASDLTQQTFYLWARKGDQLRDPTKVKTWLFTTLYREFLKSRRRQKRFLHHELNEVEHDLPTIPASVAQQVDWRTLVACFQHIEEPYRAPLVLFYLEDHSYAEVAETLDVPIGTVMSRLARGKRKLQELVLKPSRPATEESLRGQ